MGMPISMCGKKSNEIDHHDRASNDCVQRESDKRSGQSDEQQVHHTNGQDGWDHQQNSVGKLKKRIQELQNQNDMLRNEQAAWEMQFQDIQLERNENRNEIHRLTKEADDLRTRLSKLASDRLTHNNPNIADLSDENRALKIAEQFSELYSNEWTDAFESLTADGTMTETKAIKVLWDILKNILEECKNKADKFLKDMEDATVKFIGPESNQNTSLLLKPYKDVRKKNYKNTIPSLYHMMDMCPLLNKEIPEAVRIYIESATDICWLVCIQDPPLKLFFECKKHDPFNPDYFTSYTVSGKRVSFVVWPALLLHENGPLLQKGVAQGKKRRKKKNIKGSSSINTCTLKQENTNKVGNESLSLKGLPSCDRLYHSVMGEHFDEMNGVSSEERGT